MTASSQSAARDGDLRAKTEVARATEPMTSRDGGPATGPGRAGAEVRGRTSPDPLQSTDRYRLVTPFTLRL